MSEEERDLLSEIDRSVSMMLSEALQSIDEALFDFESMCLKPLYRIEATDDEVLVTVDLPCVDREDIVINSTEDTLSVEARMRRPVTLKVGGPFQRNQSFEKFSKALRLPARVNPLKAKARFRNGILTVRLPIVRRGKKVRIR